MVRALLGPGRETKEESVLFANVYTWRADLGEEGQKRVVKLFANWKPPAGVEIKSHYEFADGSGGITISEVSTPAAGYEACGAWSAYADQRIVPLLDVRESVPIAMRVGAWRDSVR